MTDAQDAKQGQVVGLDELKDYTMGTPKVEFPEPTEVTIKEIQFFKNEKPMKDSKNNEYIPGYFQVSFETGEGVVAIENYGVRLYTSPGGVNLYSGKKAAWTKFKEKFIEKYNLDKFMSPIELIANIKGKKCIAQSIQAYQDMQGNPKRKIAIQSVVE